jgi:hypothetical protein
VREREGQRDRERERKRERKRTEEDSSKKCYIKWIKESGR